MCSSRGHDVIGNHLLHISLSPDMETENEEIVILLIALFSNILLTVKIQYRITARIY